MSDTDILAAIMDIQARLSRLEAVETPLTIAPANPTATAGKTAVNGTATSYMRSDGAPAVGDSDKTDGFHASATPAASTIAVADGSGKLDGWVTANPTPANPTATAGKTAVNGSAATFMRSDAAPAIGDSDQTDGLHADNTAAATAHLVATDSSGNVHTLATTVTTATISGALTHTGSTAGFYNTTPISRPASPVAITISVGTPGNAITDVGTTHDQNILNSDFRVLTDQVNSIRTMLKNLGLIN